jgi:hypothetical protein
MVKFIPEVVIHENLNIPVLTAGENQPPQIGVSDGTIPVGSLNVEAIEVATFSKNLVSATQLSIEHGCKQTGFFEATLSELLVFLDGLEKLAKSFVLNNI